ncbi:MAG: hypothetical protein ACKVU2_02750, partial [Saprospiraceae bacterium]
MIHPKVQFCALPLLLLTAWPFFAQDSPKKFGKPDLSELQLTTCSFEPGASAMVLFDVGEAEMEI